MPAQVSLSSVSRNGRGFCLDITGSEGALLLSSSNQKDYVHGFELHHAARGEDLRPVSPDADVAFPQTWTDGRIAPVARVLGWWADSIRQGRPMVPGLAEGLASRRVSDRAAQAAPGIA